MSNRFRKQAIKELVNYNASFSLDENGEIVMWVSDTPQPSEEAIASKATELSAAEPMRLLREERDRKLSDTDWWASSDLTMTQAQTDYRQALRDITNSYTSLDDVVWPTKP
tara:strand:- start:48 stop:380 length:333 start_codon:yes stop_codon:yes gene_type:complete